MKNDPCKMCLVRACCKIPECTIWWDCGCGPYERYKLWEFLSVKCASHLVAGDFKMKHLEERLS